MAFRVNVTPEGLVRKARIARIVREKLSTQLRLMGANSIIDVSRKVESRSVPPGQTTAPVLDKAVEDELRRLGVTQIVNDGDTKTRNDIIVGNHTLTSIDELLNHIKDYEETGNPTVLLHILQPLLSHGIPADDIGRMQGQVATDMKVLATGLCSARGIAATGNLGAISILQSYGRILGALTAVLNGGLGTRLFALRKLKGSIEAGRTNLTVFNIMTGLWFRSQMPKIPLDRATVLSVLGGQNPANQSILDALFENPREAELKFKHTVHPDFIKRTIIDPIDPGKRAAMVELWQSVSYLVTLANDGILVPSGHLIWRGMPLENVTAKNARPCYFFVSNDEPTISEAESYRYGLIAEYKGRIVYCGEKEGRLPTLEAAEEVLNKYGIENVNKDEIRLYINRFGMSTMQAFETDLKTTLQILMAPHLTADEIADLDTYGLLLAAISSPSADDFRVRISGNKKLNKLVCEPQTDLILYRRLRQTLFEHERNATGDLVEKRDENGLPICRVGLAEMNQGAIAIDIGTLEALYDFYSSLVKNYDRSGETRDQFLAVMRRVQETGQISTGDQRILDQIEELERVLRSNERVARYAMQRIAGLNPTLPVENCELRGDPLPELVPILGIDSDTITLPEELKAAIGDSEMLRPIYDMILSQTQDRLFECRRLADGTIDTTHRIGESTEGELLYYFDPEGIDTLKIADSRILPGTIVGRNCLVYNSEIGDAENRVIIPNGTMVVASKVTQSILHKQPEKAFDETTIRQKLLQAKRDGNKKYEAQLSSGWKAVFRYRGTAHDQRTGQDVLAAIGDIASLQGRNPAGIPQPATAGFLPPAVENLRQQLGLHLSPTLIPVFDGRAQDHRQINGSAGSFGAVGLDITSPSTSDYWEIELRRTPQAQAIIYGREQTAKDKQIILIENAAYGAKDPTGTTPIQHYKAPMAARPNQPGDWRGLNPGVHMKSHRMQLEYGKYYSRSNYRDATALQTLEGNPGSTITVEMTQAVETLMQQLPAIASMPEQLARSIVDLGIINQVGMTAAIQTALSAGSDPVDAIMAELRRQTPTILANYISQSIGKPAAAIRGVIAGFQSTASRTSRTPLTSSTPGVAALIQSLNGLAGPDLSGLQTKQVMDIIQGFPFSKFIFTSYGLSPEAFRSSIWSMVESFRFTRRQLSEPVDSALTISIPLQDTTLAALVASETTTLIKKLLK